MELFFGRVDFDQYDNVDPSDCFEVKGEHYWYRAVIDEDQICFYDTCGRHFPIALENIAEADNALFAAKEIYNAEQECLKIKQRARNKLEQLLEFWDKE